MVSKKDVKEQMSVVAADGQKLGTVDRCEKGQIKLKKDANGEHHFVDMGSVDRIDGNQVRLKEGGATGGGGSGGGGAGSSDRASG
jgi:hypothetical protein